MKTLLAIINEPRESKEFLRYVAGMANDLQGLVKVLYVQAPTNYPLGFTASTELPSLEAQGRMEMLAKESHDLIQKHMKDIVVELSNNNFAGSSSEIGSADVIVDELVSQNKVDMVVLEGQQDESFWTQSSSNMDVIQKVTCPVWIIPKGAVYAPFREIVYATDYKKEDITNLKRLIAMMPNLTPHITALHITDSVDFEAEVRKSGFVERLREQTSYPQLDVKALYQAGHDDLIELINDYSVKNGANLIVVLKENESFFERIFKPSHTKKILKTTDLPVLVYHERK
jgi:nucleotide-binding universal stress UspA family protein